MSNLSMLLKTGLTACVLCLAFTPPGHAAEISATWTHAERGVVSKIVSNQASDFFVSPDGRRVAYIAGAGEKWPEGWEKYVIVADGKVGKAYDSIRQPPLFSPDSKRFAYMAGIGSEKPNAVVIDGVEKSYGESAVAEEDKKLGSVADFVFSPDSQSYAYAVMKGFREKNSYIILNGKKLQPHTEVKKPVFSSDNSRLGYIASLPDEKGMVVVIDGKAGERFDKIHELMFSPDSRQFAYMAQNDNKNESRILVVRNGIKSKGYSGSVGGLGYSMDSQHFVYAAGIEPGKSTVVFDDKEIGGYWENVHTPIFSPNGKQLAYIVESKEQGKRQYRAVVDGQMGGGYDFIAFGHLSFSVGSQHVVYSGRKNKESMVVLNGVPKKPYKSVEHVMFNPVTGQLVYVAKENSMAFVVQGERIGQPYYYIDDLVYSPDGKTLAYSAYTQKDQKWRVVINGQEGKPYDLVLADDAYVEKLGSVKGSSLRFDSNGKLRYLAVRGKQIVMVEAVAQ